MALSNAEKQKRHRDKNRSPDKKELRRWVKKSNVDKFNKAIDKIDKASKKGV